MYFLNPFSIVLLASAATVSAAPYTNATIHVRTLNSTAPYTNATIVERTVHLNATLKVRAPYPNTPIEGRGPHSNTTFQARGSNATIATAPLVTPAVRRNIIPLYRRKAQAPATSLCAQLGVINGCINPDGKGTGNLPAAISVNSALTSIVSEATSLVSALPTPLATPPKIPVPMGSGAPSLAGGIPKPMPKAGLPPAFPTVAVVPKGIIPPSPLATASAPFQGRI